MAYGCFDPVLAKTEVFAWRFDHDARPIENPVRVAQPRGAVVSIAAAVSTTTVWLGWITHEGDGADRADGYRDHGQGTRSVSVVSATADLGESHGVTELSRFELADAETGEGRWWPRAAISLGADVNGAIAVFTDAMETCTQDPDGQALDRAVPCASWTEVSLTLDGPPEKLHHSRSRTPSVEPGSLVRANLGWVYARGSDYIRPTIAVHEVLPPGRAPLVPQAFRLPLIDWTDARLAYTGTALIGIGTDHPLDGRPSFTALRTVSASGQTLPRYVSTPSIGTPAGTSRAEWPRLLRTTLTCVSSPPHPVVRLATRNHTVTLDPTLPDASLDLGAFVTPAMLSLEAPPTNPSWRPPLAWAGNALLALSPHGVPVRFVCRNHRVVSL